MHSYNKGSKKPQLLAEDLLRQAQEYARAWVKKNPDQPKERLVQAVKRKFNIVLT